MLILPVQVKSVPVKPSAEQEQEFYETYASPVRTGIYQVLGAVLVLLLGGFWIGGNVLP